MLEGLLMFSIQDALFLLGYLARGNAFPKPLSREEEAEMIERMQRGDRSAREKLIEHNLRLAAHIARKYTVPGLSLIHISAFRWCALCWQLGI